jgi:hypothetical protein
VAGMKKKPIQVIEQIIIYTPLAGILGGSLMNLNAFQHQLLMLFSLIWLNTFFIYKSWLSQ